MSGSEAETDQLDAVISALKDDEDIRASDSEDEKKPKKKKAGAPAGPPPTSAKRSGAPAGPPPAGAKRALAGPPKTAPPPKSPEPQQSVEEDRPTRAPHKAHNKLYYSRFEEESNVFKDLLNATDKKWAKLSMKAVFVLCLVGAVGMGAAMFGMAIQSWHMPCDQSLDLLLLTMGLLSILLAGLVIGMVTTEGEVSRVFGVATSVASCLYFTFLVLDSMLVYGEFSEAYSTTCDASGQLDLSTDVVEASWGFVASIVCVAVVKQALSKAKKSVADNDYSRLTLEGVDVRITS